MRNEIRLVIRLPSHLHQQLTAEAKRAGVSLNTLMATKLENARGADLTETAMALAAFNRAMAELRNALDRATR